MAASSRSSSCAGHWTTGRPVPDALKQAGAGVRLCTGLGGTGEGMFVSPLAIQPGFADRLARISTSTVPPSASFGRDRLDQHLLAAEQPTRPRFLAISVAYQPPRATAPAPSARLPSRSICASMMQPLGPTIGAPRRSPMPSSVEPPFSQPG